MHSHLVLLSVFFAKWCEWKQHASVLRFACGTRSYSGPATAVINPYSAKDCLPGCLGRSPRQAPALSLERVASGPEAGLQRPARRGSVLSWIWLRPYCGLRLSQIRMSSTGEALLLAVEQGQIEEVKHAPQRPQNFLFPKPLRQSLAW